MALGIRRLPAAFVAASLLAGATVAQCAPQWQPGDPRSTPIAYTTALLPWDPDGAGPAGQELLAAGSLQIGAAAGFQGLMTWDGTAWGTLGQVPSNAGSMAIYNGQPVVAAAGLIRRWDGTAWQQIGTYSGLSSARVAAMTVFNGELIVAGWFTSVNGVAASNIARWNGTTWSTVSGGLTGEVHALAVHGGAVFAGGVLTAAGANPAGNIAAWNGTNWLALPSIDGTVRALAVRNGTSALNSYLFVGGTFTNVGTVSCSNVVRYQALTGTWTAMGSLPSTSALFVRATGLNSYEVTAGAGWMWLWDGTAWSGMGASLGGSVSAITWFDGRYTIGFADAYGQYTGVAAWDGVAWNRLHGVGIDGEVLAVQPTATDLVIGGRFRSISGVVMNGVARGDSNAWSPMGAGLVGSSGSVEALVQLPNGDLVAGGDFTLATGGAADRIARWNGSTWVPMGLGLSGPVHALTLLSDGSLVAGGGFVLSGVSPGRGVARWNGSSWVDVGGGVNGTVRALAALPDGGLVVGGQFTRAGSSLLVVANVARWQGGSWYGMQGGVDGEVLALATTPNSIVVGGRFLNAGPTSFAHVARFANGWEPIHYGGAVFNLDVYSLLVLPDQDVLVGGERFQTGAGYENLVRVEPAAFSLLSIGGTVRALAATPSGDVIAVGDMSPYTVTATRVARLAATCPATAVPYGAGCAGAGGLDVLTATTLPWNECAFRARATGLPAPSLAFVLYGFAPIAVPIAALLPEGLPGCTLLTTPDLLSLAVPTAGVLDTEIVIAPTPSLVGATFYHQVLPLELNGVPAVTGITATNGLLLTVGSF